MKIGGDDKAVKACRLSPGLTVIYSVLIATLQHLYQCMCRQREGASLVAQMVKNPPAMWETLVLSLSQEDPLEKEMTAQSSILAWKIPQTEEPGGLPSMGSQKSQT